MDNLFAVVTPGLEHIALNEMHGLGLNTGTKENGGISFTGDIKAIYQSNLNLRTVSRILVRLGNFHASAFSELRKKASRLPWEKFIFPGQPVSIRASCHKSRLYHSDGVIERVLGALSDRLGSTSINQKPIDMEDKYLYQLIVVRLLNDECTISIDSSGELLHRRGYRFASAKAPIRETLAAATVLASDWNKIDPLLDPFCGSGTIPIEAALLAKGTPPGLHRQFAFMLWPNYNNLIWENMLATFHSKIKSKLPIIQASDRDAGAIEMSIANAMRAGVEDMIEFNCKAISSILPPPPPGFLVTNPPYGFRVTSNKDLRNLYAQFGNVARDHCRNWNISILCSDLNLLAQTRINLDTSIRFNNGGIGVFLGKGIVL
ncbi:MAG: class I SAM-dependent RNA methyltransferase [Chloroflexota bacterium]